VFEGKFPSEHRESGLLPIESFFFRIVEIVKRFNLKNSLGIFVHNILGPFEIFTGGDSFFLIASFMVADVVA